MPLHIRIEFCNKSIMERFCMLNTATLSTWTHLAPNPARNTLNYAYRGHSRSHILGSLKSRRGPAYCIIMCALESEISKERSKHVRFR